MARVEVSTQIGAPVGRVWEVLTDWEGQPRWMRDARSVQLRSPHREGTGVLLRCRTDIAGLVVSDDMVVTQWEEQRIVGVRHLGRIIRGVGAFELTPTGAGTRFVWWEEIEVPLGSVGDALAALVVVPPVRRVFRASLAALKRICESESAPAADPPVTR